MPNPKETLCYSYLLRLQSKGIKLFAAKPRIQLKKIFFSSSSLCTKDSFTAQNESFLSPQDSVIVTKGTSVERHSEDLLHD